MKKLCFRILLVAALIFAVGGGVGAAEVFSPDAWMNPQMHCYH